MKQVGEEWDLRVGPMFVRTALTDFDIYTL